MIDFVFDQCVLLLLFLARHLGITYKEINVWIFVVIWPVITLILLAIIVLQQRRIRQLVRDQHHT